MVIQQKVVCWGGPLDGVLLDRPVVVEEEAAGESNFICQLVGRDGRSYKYILLYLDCSIDTGIMSKPILIYHTMVYNRFVSMELLNLAYDSAVLVDLF